VSICSASELVKIALIYIRYIKNLTNPCLVEDSVVISVVFENLYNLH
jgi:hypothetical protein